MRKRSLFIGAVAAVLVSAGCSGSGESGSEHATERATSATATAAPTTQSAEAHNDADVTFAQHMIPHHQQAIEMSDIVLTKQGIDPRVTALANQIKAAQGPEIQQMRDWMKQWGNPPMPPMPHGDMPGHGEMPAMSGMVSAEDIAALRDAQGVEASKSFLMQMIAHHNGAITMAQNEIDDGQYSPAVEMARSIVATQQQEIDTMKGILGSL